MRYFFLALFLMAFSFGCSTVPPKTEVYESAAVDLSQGKIDWDGDVVVADTRDYLQHSLAKLSGSQYLNWRDFAQLGARRDYRVHSDLQQLSRRLATYGIGPSKRVIIVGDIQDGRGEAGRMAWTLAFLGLEYVDMVDMRSLKDVKWETGRSAKPRKNLPAWTVKPNLKLNAERKELLDSAMEPDGDTVILDVRSEKEYLKNEKAPELGAINVDWREFFLENGLPDNSIIEKLAPLGVLKDKRIITLSDRGVRSGAVCFALHKMGFRNVANFSQGLDGLNQQ